MPDNDFSFEITKKIGEFGAPSKAGWITELNLVSWSGREPKFDIRSWAPDHKKMGKGLTLTKEELIGLKELLSSLDIDSL